jgi:hypothetical protein
MIINRHSTADPSTVARRAKADEIDAAIDHVTARMVQVREDDELASRIARALPQRSSRFQWLLPQLAAITVVAIAVGVWMLRDDTARSPHLPSSDVVAVIDVPITVVAVEPGTALRTSPVELLEPLEPLEPLKPLEPLDGDADHERSLPAIEAVTALAVSDLSPGELPEAPALQLEPIAIADLPLTAESFPPR